MHDIVAEVTARIARRSRNRRADYLARMDDALRAQPGRFGRELFGHMRRAVSSAEAGASVLF